jgi:vitamin-K-epoxide reductase (warfarin-sensitive)
MRLLRLLIALLAVGGVVDSSLALRIHFQSADAAPPCAVSARWDCGAVNHSRFAVFPPTSFDEDASVKHVHMPVALAGIFGYALLALLALVGRPWWVLQVAEVGFACAAMLTYMEAYVMQKWCIYCVWSQALIAAILLCSVVLCFVASTVVDEYR